MTYADKRVYLPQTFFVDSAFLQMFDFRMLQGDRATALQKPNSAVLTSSAARKLFGSEDPIGRRVSHFDADTAFFTVTGVMADVPQNSQLQFDGLFSFNTIYKPDWMNWWGGNWLDTYFELAPNTDVAALEKKFPAYLKRHLQGDGWTGRRVRGHPRMSGKTVMRAGPCRAGSDFGAANRNSHTSPDPKRPWVPGRTIVRSTVSVTRSDTALNGFPCW